MPDCQDTERERHSEEEREGEEQGTGERETAGEQLGEHQAGEAGIPRDEGETQGDHGEEGQCQRRLGVKPNRSEVALPRAAPSRSQK